MKKTFLSLSLLIVSIFIADAQTSVIPFNPNTDMLNGILYNLPKTEVNIAITATCRIEKAGPFYQYAERYLATDDIIISDSHKWELEDIEIKPMTVADANKTYMVEYDAKGIANNITYYGNNIIAGVNSNAVPEYQTNINEEIGTPSEIIFDYGCLGEEALVSTSIPKMAEMAARQIYRIRESRIALLSAEVENMPDGKAVKIMLKQLEKEEKELVSLFVGKTTTYSVKKVFTIDPDDDINNKIIARLSAAEGIVEAKNVIGSPIYLSIKGKYITAPNIDPRMEKGTKGFYYNVPGEAEIRVVFDKTAKEATLTMPQFGYVTFLNAAITNNNKTQITFNPELGTITSIVR